VSWDEKRRVELGEEWPGFWIDLFEDPPMGAWLDLQEAAIAAMHNPGDQKAIEKAISAFRPLVAGHNITDRDGKPMELSLRAMNASLFRSVLSVVQRAMAGEGTPTPLPSRATSRGRSSQANPRRRASSSGRSQVG
jgi:hypothetical protein